MTTRLLIHPDELTVKWIDRMKSLGVDVLALHPVGGEAATDALSDLVNLLKTDKYRALIDYAADSGLKIEYEMHAAGYLLPRGLFGEHPEYFRADENGKRVADRNFCVSNNEALDIVASRASELADTLYRCDGDFYFWLDDTRKGGCHCDKCRDLSPSDQQLIAVNAMARKLRKVRPNARISYLAYLSAITPPEKVRPAEGVFLEYAPFDRDMKKSVRAMPEEESENIDRLLKFFGREGSRVLEYWFDNSLFSKWKKPPARFTPDSDMIRDDMDFYVGKGFEQIGSFACYLGPDYEELYGEPDVSAIAKN